VLGSQQLTSGRLAKRRRLGDDWMRRRCPRRRRRTDPTSAAYNALPGRRCQIRPMIYYPTPGNTQASILPPKNSRWAPPRLPGLQRLAIGACRAP
jgi:hypothetical protein